MRIVEALERQPIMISVAELLDSDGKFEFLPEVKQKGYFDVDFRGDSLVLMAGKYIGQIPITQNVAIVVRPKIPLINLNRIISVARKPVKCLEFFRRRYGESDYNTQSFLEAMARSLISTLLPIQTKGLWREYKEVRKDLISIRGKVDVSAYLATSLARARPSTVPCNYFEFDADTVFNRVIKASIYAIAASLQEFKNPPISLLRDLEYFSDYFDSVATDRSKDLVLKCMQEHENNKIPQLRGYYNEILETAYVILSGQSLDILDSGNRFGMHSVIVNLEDTFEAYIRMVLTERLQGLGISVMDGNEDGQGKLFFDSKKYITQPDYIVSNKFGVSIIGDAKYKPKLAEGDRYQLISHAAAHGAKIAFIIQPAMDKKKIGPEYVGAIFSSSPIAIYVYHYDLNAADIASQEQLVTSWMESLLAPSAEA